MKVAIIGCGFQGRVHLEAFRQIEDAEVVAVCDVDAARCEQVADEYGVPNRYDDYRRLLDAHELDLLTVCTMPATHRAITVDAFDAGAHVLCEKPFALSLDEAKDMVAASRAAGRLLTIGFNMRYTVNARLLHDLVAGGQVGRPLCGRAWGLAGEPPWWGRHYERTVSGGGSLAATAVHLVDLALWAAGFPKPLTASASAHTVFPRKRGWTAPSAEQAAAYDVDDLIAAHVRFEDGFWLTIQGAWVWDSPGWDYSFQLQCEDGLLAFDPLRVTLEQGDALVDATPQIKRPIDWALDFPSSVAAQIEDFVAAIREGRDSLAGLPLVQPEQALVTQSITDAIYRSAAAEAEVPVEQLTEEVRG